MDAKNAGEHGDTSIVTVAIRMHNPSLQFLDRWQTTNFAMAKVLCSAPTRTGQFDWSTVPDWGLMEQMMFGRPSNAYLMESFELRAREDQRNEALREAYEDQVIREIRNSS